MFSCLIYKEAVSVILTSGWGTWRFSCCTEFTLVEEQILSKKWEIFP